MNNIQGKWALVTGASRGVGKEIATALSKLGCHLILHSRSVEHTRLLGEDLALNGVEVISLAADLSVSEQVDHFISKLVNSAPPIDILYNNAAILQPDRGDLCAIPAEDFRLSFETNVISPIKICNALIPLMIERQWGRVINLTTDMVMQPNFSPYAISKAALRTFVYDFVPVLEGTNVTMNALNPGWLRTDMGTEHANNAVEDVIPGALVPALLSDPGSGNEFHALDYTGLSIENAINKFP